MSNHKKNRKNNNHREHRKMSSDLLLPHSVLTAMIHFCSKVLRLNVRYPSFIIINKYINTSVATVAIKGEIQAYMKRATGEGKGTKDVTRAQWQRQGERDNTMCVKY